MHITSATIQNDYGIHCRPSGEIAKFARAYPGKITITSPDGNSASPASVLSLLGLGLAKGDTVIVSVDGPDEIATANKIASMLSACYSYDR